MDTVFQIEGQMPADEAFPDLCLPEIDHQLDVIKASGKRSIIVAVCGVAITSLLVLTDFLPLVLAGMERVELEIPFVKTDLILAFALCLVFTTMMGSFAFCLPRIQEQVATYSKKFDTVVTIARQITLADGIGDNEKRKVASEVLWQAKSLRKKSRKRLMGAAMGTILLGCFPWVLALAMINIMQCGPTVLIMTLCIVALKLMLVQRILRS